MGDGRLYNKVQWMGFGIDHGICSSRPGNEAINVLARLHYVITSANLWIKLYCSLKPSYVTSSTTGVTSSEENIHLEQKVPGKTYEAEN